MGKRSSVRAVETGTSAPVGARNALLQPKQSAWHASDQGFDNTQDVPGQCNAGISDLPTSSTLGHSFSQITVHPSFQAKLTVGALGDKYEQEADRVANAVMHMPEPVVQRQEDIEEEEREKEEEIKGIETKSLVETITPLAQRQVNEAEEEEKPEEEEEAVRSKSLSGYGSVAIHRQAEEEEEREEEEEKSLQTKRISVQSHSWIQRQGEPEEEEEEEEEARGEPVQTQPATLRSDNQVQRQAEGEQEKEKLLQPKARPGKVPTVPSDLEAKINRMHGHSGSLPTGHDFGQVRIHAHGQAASAARALNAQAFTRGRDIFFGAGRYQPETVSGQRLLAHELTHTIQQTGSRPLATARGAATSTATTWHPGGQSGSRVNGQQNHLELTRGTHSPRVISRAPAIVLRQASPAAAEAAEGVAPRGGLEADLATIIDILDELHYSDSNEQAVISILERWVAVGTDKLDGLFDRLTRKTTRRGALRETTSYYSLIFNHFDRVDEVRAIRDTFSRRYQGDEGIAEASVTEQLKEGGWKTTAKEYWGKKFKQLGEELDAVGAHALEKQLLGGAVGVIQGFAELAVELVEGLWTLGEAILHLHGAFYYFITGALQGAGLGFLKRVPLVGHVFDPRTYRSSYDKTVTFFESAGAALQNPGKIWAGIKEAASTAWGEVMTEYAAADEFNKSRIIARGVVKVGMAVGGVIKSLPQLAKGAVKLGAAIAKVAVKVTKVIAKALMGAMRIGGRIVRGTWKVVRQTLQNGKQRLAYFFKKVGASKAKPVDPRVAERYVHCSKCKALIPKARVSGKNPPISPRQKLHTTGTPGKSQFKPGVDAESVTRTAWEQGKPVFDKKGKFLGKRFTFKDPVGTSPAGYDQHSVFVHWSPTKGIHGVPTTVGT
jgi:hypothetical protein